MCFFHVKLKLVRTPKSKKTKTKRSRNSIRASHAAIPYPRAIWRRRRTNEGGRERDEKRTDRIELWRNLSNLSTEFTYYYFVALKRHELLWFREKKISERIGLPWVTNDRMSFVCMKRLLFHFCVREAEKNESWNGFTGMTKSNVEKTKKSAMRFRISFYVPDILHLHLGQFVRKENFQRRHYAMRAEWHFGCTATRYISRSELNDSADKQR